MSNKDGEKIDISGPVTPKSKKIIATSLKRNTTKNSIKRDHEGKFTSGSGGLKKIQHFNWSRALPVVVIVSLVGGFFVFKSFASGSRAEVTKWYRTCLNREPEAGGLNYWAGRLDSGEHAWAVADSFMKTSGITSCNYPNEPKNTPKSSPTPASPSPATPVTPSPSSSTPGSNSPVAASSTNSARELVNSFYAACAYSAIPQYSNSGYQFWLTKLTGKVTDFKNSSQINSVWQEFRQTSINNGIQCSSSYTTTYNTNPVPNPTGSTGSQQGKKPQNNSTGQPNANRTKQQKLDEMRAWEKLASAYLANAKIAREKSAATSKKQTVTYAEYMSMYNDVNHYKNAIDSLFAPLQKLNTYRNEALNDTSQTQISKDIVSSFNNYYRDSHALVAVQKQILEDYNKSPLPAGYRKLY